MVLSHMVSPLSHGLFHGVISQSGAPVDIFQEDKRGSYRKTVLDIATRLGCSTLGQDVEVVECLQGVDRDVFYYAAMNVSKENIGRGFGQLVDKDFAESPFYVMEPEAAFASGEFAKVPLMIGFNKDGGIHRINYRYVQKPSNFKS
eukprot:TRINITY_DN10308_c0_g1_i1.p3 TRINITY_DN10308_c0_g1~~TRINITY_DN10308_c0_g1_i1.p3  ORF type:complete len:146 (+),score=49.40 TRINITY_DN10308_c0_g1_i1:152-589(+)